MTALRLACFVDAPGARPRPGLATERGIVEIDDPPTLAELIAGFDAVRPQLEDLVASGAAHPASDVSLRADPSSS